MADNKYIGKTAPDLGRSNMYDSAGDGKTFHLSEIPKWRLGNSYSAGFDYFSNAGENIADSEHGISESRKPVESYDNRGFVKSTKSLSATRDTKTAVSSSTRLDQSADYTDDESSSSSNGGNRQDEQMLTWRKMLLDPLTAGQFLSKQWPRISLRASYKRKEPYVAPDEEDADLDLQKEENDTIRRRKCTIYAIISGILLVVIAIIPVIVITNLQKEHVGKFPEFCVAARIKQNGDVERILHKCTSPLPGLYIEIQNVPSNDLSKTSSPLPSATSFSSRLDKTSPPLPNTTFQGQTISTYSASLKSTYLSQLASKSSALKESIGTSIVVQATAFVGFPETTSPDLLEFPSSDVPAKDELGGISAIVIIAIVAAFLIVIVILVTVVLCKRKRKTQVPTSNKPLTMVGKEVVYAHVNKPTVKREKSTSSQKSQPAASDDTYDHMEHCRLSQTHNPAERNYDTMRSIANGGEEENNYDHVTGTKMEPKRFVFDIATNNSHVEVEFHEVNSWSK